MSVCLVPTNRRYFRSFVRMGARRTSSRATMAEICCRARWVPWASAPLELERHIAWDIGAAGLARRLADELDAFLIVQIYSGSRSTVIARRSRRLLSRH